MGTRHECSKPGGSTPLNGGLCEREAVLSPIRAIYGGASVPPWLAGYPAGGDRANGGVRHGGRPTAGAQTALLEHV